MEHVHLTASIFPTLSTNPTGISTWAQPSISSLTATLLFAVDGHQLAFQSGEGAFDDSPVRRGRGGRSTLRWLLRVVEHEAEALHLLVGDDGGGCFVRATPCSG